MAKKLTNSEIEQAILNKLNAINDKFDNIYSLVKIIGLGLVVNKVFVVIKNLKYNVEKSINYSKFLICKNRPFISNKKEQYEILKDKYFKKISEKLKDLNDPDIRFDGFSEKELTCSDPWIKFTNIRYNESGKTRYSHFIKSGWNCKTVLKRIRQEKCTGLFKLMSESEAEKTLISEIQKLNKEYNKNYKFIEFNGGYKGWENTLVTIQDLSTNEIKVLRYSSFRKHKGWSNKYDRLRIDEEEIVERINNKLTELGLTNKLKFVSFENNAWEGVENSRLIFLNLENNQEILIKYHSFIESGCSLKNISINENRCKCILNELNIKYTQYNPIKNFDKQICKNEIIYPDFYLESYNCYIEYDGEQHYVHVQNFQETYQKFVNQVNRDRALEKYCEENGVKLLRISYLDNNRLQEVIEDFLVRGINTATKIEPKLLPAIIYGQDIISRS